MKILLLGKGGQIASEFEDLKTKDKNWTFLSREDLDITSKESILSYFRLEPYELVINCTGFTSVDQAEDMEEQAYSINEEGVKNLIEACEKFNCKLIHYSTDYVFDGSKSIAYKEDDIPNPISFYGATKLQGEKAVRENNPKHVILRTSWVFSPHGNNFVKTIIELAKNKSALTVVSDQLGSPTSSRWIARSTHKILNKLQEKDCYGTYHVVCDGVTNWFTFAQNILLMLEEKTYEKKLEFNQITPIKSDEYPTKAKRPKNSALSYQKLNSLLDISPPSWKNELNRVIDSIILMEN